MEVVSILFWTFLLVFLTTTMVRHFSTWLAHHHRLCYFWQILNSVVKTGRLTKNCLGHFQGPAMFHRSAMLFYASHLLSSAPASRQSDFMTSQYDLLPLNVTLGGIDTQLSQLRDFTRHLWKHAGVLTTEQLSLG